MKIRAYHVDERIDMTGQDWYMSVFNRCILECNKDKETRFFGCVFSNCQFVGDGWPDYILDAQDKAA